VDLRNKKHVNQGGRAHCKHAVGQYGTSMMKDRIKTWLGAAGLGLMLGGVTLLATGCAGTVGYNTPGYGGYYNTPGYAGYYNYDYYPDLNVYYYPSGGYYHWYDGGHWRTGRHLPPGYTIGHARREQLRSHTQQPWTEHERHEFHEHER
jgi:hypothetical protein